MYMHTHYLTGGILISRTLHYFTQTRLILRKIHQHIFWNHNIPSAHPEKHVR